jgi:hypothetical protein
MANQKALCTPDSGAACSNRATGMGATYIVGLLFVFFPNVSSSRRADEILKLILLQLAK